MNNFLLLGDVFTGISSNSYASAVGVNRLASVGVLSNLGEKYISNYAVYGYT